MTKIQVQLSRSIRGWYHKTYPTDELWTDVADITFAQLLACLLSQEADDTYPIMGDDSIIRERLFTELHNITGMPYDDIYDIWVMLKKF